MLLGCNLRRVSHEEILLDETSEDCFRKKCFDDIDSRSQFLFLFFDLGSDLIFNSRSIFLYFLFFISLNLDDDSRSILDFQLMVEF
jgi:hypothetical protein